MGLSHTWNLRLVQKKLVRLFATKTYSSYLLSNLLFLLFFLNPILIGTLGEKRPKPLKVEEEQLLRAFYEFKIQDVCDAFKFPRKIQV